LFQAGYFFAWLLNALGFDSRESCPLLGRHQSLPRASESQLNPKSRGEENVDFSGFNFLKIPRGDFGPFGQFILRQTFAHPFPAHIGAENLDSIPFFPGNGHDILHRLLMLEMNDTYIVKTAWIFLAREATHMNYQCNVSLGRKFLHNQRV